MKTSSLKYHSLLLLWRIRDDLNPDGFTCTEIVEEGFITTDSHAVSSSTLFARGVRRLGYLIQEGMVERIDGTRDHYRVTEFGRDVNAD